MLRWLATGVIVALLGLDWMLPNTSLGRRGSDLAERADVPGVAERVGQVFPDFELPDLDGDRVRVSDLRGHRVLLVFERSVDW
jgi:cytochrome oxidase Cu insertion factor (SCO1/SenC/PrrC family)